MTHGSFNSYSPENQLWSAARYATTYWADLEERPQQWRDIVAIYHKDVLSAVEQEFGRVGARNFRDFLYLLHHRYEAIGLLNGQVPTWLAAYDPLHDPMVSGVWQENATIISERCSLNPLMKLQPRLRIPLELIDIALVSDPYSSRAVHDGTVVYLEEIADIQRRLLAKQIDNMNDSDRQPFIYSSGQLPLGDRYSYDSAGITRLMIGGWL